MESEAEIQSSTTEVFGGYERIPVINTKTGSVISGAAAPMKRNLEAYLRKRPHLQVWAEGIGESSARPFSDNSSSQGMLVDSAEIGDECEENAMIVDSYVSLCGTEINLGNSAASILDSLSAWGDAVEAMSTVMDRTACAALIEEIADLQHEVASRRYTAQSMSLKTLEDCQFPSICGKIMSELEKAKEQPFQDHVTTIMDAFSTIQDPTCIGTNEIADLLAEKSKQFQELSARIDNHNQEKDRILQKQQNLANETLHEIEMTTETLWNLQNEKESIKASLAQVRKKAAKQRYLLERQLEKNGHSENSAREETENTANVDSECTSSNILSTALNRQQEKSAAVVSATQDHIDLVATTADFVREAGSSVKTLLRSMMKKALQEELKILVQDQAHAAFFVQQMKDITTGETSSMFALPQSLLTPSVASRYRGFFHSQLQNIGARHVLNRYAALGLMSYLGGGDCQQLELDREILEFVKQIISKLDEMRNISQAKAPPSFQIHMPGSVLAICSEISDAAATATSQCSTRLKLLSTKPSCDGRLVVRAAAVKEEELRSVCDLIWAFSSLQTLHSDLTRALEKELVSLSRCTCDAVNQVLSGCTRHALCIIQTTGLSAEDGDVQHICNEHTLSYEVLGVTIINARMQHTWLERIAVIELFNKCDNSLPLLNDTSVRIINWSANVPHSSHSMQVDHDTNRSDSCGEWKSAVDTVNAQLTAFQPQLIMVHVKCARSRHGSALARRLALQDWEWVGRTVARFSSAICDGRLVVNWEIVGGAQLFQNALAAMTDGMLHP